MSQPYVNPQAPRAFKKERRTTLFFDNLEKFASGLNPAPAFKSFTLDDLNPLSGSRRQRVIYAPNRSMAKVHQLLLTYLRKIRGNKPAHITACYPGCSPRLGLNHHLGHRFFYLVDLTHAYESVNRWQLVSALTSLDSELIGSELKIHVFLQRFCLLPDSKKGGLVIGVPASPDLFNIYCHFWIDPSLLELSRKHGLTYTRYLDDLVFPANESIGKHKRQAVREVVESARFSVAHHKCRVADLSKGPVVINGYGLDLTGRVFIPSRFRRRVSGVMHLASRGKVVESKVHGLMGVIQSTGRPRGLIGGETRRLFRNYRQFSRSMR